jgi:hypothetical protein
MPEHVRQIALEAFAGVVDPYFARALDPAIGCWLVRGHLPHRISRVIEIGHDGMRARSRPPAAGAQRGPRAKGR